MSRNMDLGTLPPEKIYFSIGEVGDFLQVNTSLIRYWEKEFPEIKPRKNRKGDRSYTKTDIEILQKIYHLVKEKGYTLEGAKKALKEKDSPAHDKAILDTLIQLRHTLYEIKESLDQDPDEK